MNVVAIEEEVSVLVNRTMKEFVEHYGEGRSCLLELKREE